MYVHVRFEPSVIGFFDPLVVDDEGEGMGSQQNLSSPKARIDTHWTIFSRMDRAWPSRNSYNRHTQCAKSETCTV